MYSAAETASSADCFLLEAKLMLVQTSRKAVPSVSYEDALKVLHDDWGQCDWEVIKQRAALKLHRSVGMLLSR